MPTSALRQRLAPAFALAALAAAAALAPTASRAAAVTVPHLNSSLKYEIDDDDFNPGTPADPVQFARRMTWTVDGREILVYPTSYWLDIGHLHPGAHVRNTQIHAQGPMFGYATNALAGTVTGGVVYSLTGSKAGCGTSRISEKLDIVNNTGSDFTLRFYAMGFNPSGGAHGSTDVPDLTGVTLTGTTTMTLQGRTGAPSIHDAGAGFGPLTVSKVVKFTGFNTAQTPVIPAGAMLTVVTEINAKLSGIGCLVRPLPIRGTLSDEP